MAICTVSPFVSLSISLPQLCIRMNYEETEGLFIYEGNGEDIGRDRNLVDILGDGKSERGGIFESE